GASALMQGLADGYFVVPYTIGNYLAGVKPNSRPSTDAPEFKAAEENASSIVRRLLAAKGKEPVNYYHKKLGLIMWNHCGMARTKEGLEEGIRKIQALRTEFWANVNVPGSGDNMNQALERANRVADFIEL